MSSIRFPYGHPICLLVKAEAVRGIEVPGAHFGLSGRGLSGLSERDPPHWLMPPVMKVAARLGVQQKGRFLSPSETDFGHLLPGFQKLNSTVSGWNMLEHSELKLC